MPRFDASAPKLLRLVVAGAVYGTLDPTAARLDPNPTAWYGIEVEVDYWEVKTGVLSFRPRGSERPLQISPTGWQFAGEVVPPSPLEVVT